MKIGKQKRIRGLLPVFMILAAALRIVVSHVLGLYLMPDQICDDVMMYSYAAVKSHFLAPNHYSLVKTMVYPLFLDAVSVSGIPYDICLSLLYIAAAALLFFVLKKVFQRTLPAAFGYFYLLFVPLCFDLWCGLRVYRNAIVPPLVVMLFSLMILAVYRAFFPEKFLKRSLLRSVLFGLLLGLLFTVNYYVREDGIWLLACLLVFLFAALIGKIVKGRKQFRRFGFYIDLLLVLLPLLVFTGCTHTYKKINEHFFGVYEIETRTSGEQGEFTRKLFMIDSEKRSSRVWTPADVIDRAFDVSETLRSIPGYRESILQSNLSHGDMYKKPITGERIQWLLKDALVACGAYESEAASEELFRKINAEMDAAFEDGRLQKSDRIQLLSSSGGFTKEEILALSRELWYGFRGCVLEEGYLLGAIPPDIEIRKENSETTAFAAELTNDPRLLDFETTTLTKGQCLINRCLPFLARLYAGINVLLLSSGLAVVVLGFFRLFGKKGEALLKALLSWLGSCAFLGISFVYLFGISWYSHFIWGKNAVNTVIFNFYLIALPAILLFFYLFTLNFWCRFLREKRELKRCKQETINGGITV